MGDVKYEMSEGEAIDMWAKREEAARRRGYVQGLRDAVKILSAETGLVIDAIEKAEAAKRPASAQREEESKP